MSAFTDVAGRRSTDSLHTFLQYSSLAQQNYSRLWTLIFCVTSIISPTFTSFENCSVLLFYKKLLRQAVYYIYIYTFVLYYNECLCTTLYYNFVPNEITWMALDCVAHACVYVYVFTYECSTCASTGQH